MSMALAMRDATLRLLIFVALLLGVGSGMLASRISG